MKNTPDLFITPTHSGKMSGMPSINTSTISNPFCQAQIKKENCICSSCYAYRFERIYKNNTIRYTKNGNLLSSHILTDKEIPRINYFYCRFNAYGELLNETHFKNLVLIAEHNPQTQFSLWTKRPNLITGDPPKNLKLVYSNPIPNTIMTKMPPKFDSVFNVVNKDHPDINCKERCIDCLKCYTQSNNIIIERKK